MVTVTWRVWPSCLLTAGSGMTLNHTQPPFCLVSGQRCLQLDGGNGCVDCTLAFAGSFWWFNGQLKAEALPLASALRLTLADARSCWGTLRTLCTSWRQNKQEKRCFQQRRRDISVWFWNSCIYVDLPNTLTPFVKSSRLHVGPGPVRMTQKPANATFSTHFAPPESPMARVINNK